MNSMLLVSFWEQYGLWIILIGLVALMLVYNLFRNKKMTESINELQTALVPGTKVKTYSGIYGTIEKVTDTTDGKVVTLKLSENNFMDIDINAIMNVDQKQTMEEVEMLERLSNVSNVETQEIKQEGYAQKEQEEDSVKNEDVAKPEKTEDVRPQVKIEEKAKTITRKKSSK